MLYLGYHGYKLAFLYYIFFLATTSNTQLFLTLLLGVLYGEPGIEPSLVTFKASTLPTVLSLSSKLALP